MYTEIFSTNHAYTTVCIYIYDHAPVKKSSEIIDGDFHMHFEIPAINTTTQFSYRGKLYKAIIEAVGSPVGLNVRVDQMRKIKIYDLPNSVRFIEDAETYYSNLLNKMSKNSLIVHFAKYNTYEVDWVKSSMLPGRSLSTVYASNDVKNLLVNNLRTFKNTEDEYISHGIPYKYVALLHGPPGTGKTSLIMSIAYELKIKNLYIMSFGSTMTDSYFLELVHSMKPNSILVMEDADTLVVNRKEKTGMSFTSMLNVLDGPLRPHGLVCFLTTNHMERFDSAMTRSGRINDIIEITPMSKELAAKMASDYLRINKKITKTEAEKCGQAIAQVTTNPSVISSYLFANRYNGTFKDCSMVIKDLRKFIKSRPKQ